MNSRSTRSTIDLTQTTINSLLLPIKKEQQTLTPMENFQEFSSDLVQQQLNSNQHDENSKDFDTHVRGHGPYDQQNMPNEQQQNLIKLSLNSIQKFDGTTDPQQWLKYILEKFDSLKISLRDRHNLIPEILTGAAFIWHAQEQEHMLTFSSFTKQLLQNYSHHELKTECCQKVVSSPIPSKQTEVVTTAGNVMDCLRNQMLITNFEKLQKFSGNSKQNVSKWLQEIQQTMNMFKLTDSEKLFYISLCLEKHARDWFYDNPHLCSTWILFTQNLLTTFESSGKADISFNRLRHYEQSINQDVRQYYFDIMKLCKEANPLMDDATKLQYLKDGLKSSLRFDVLLKNPQTTKEFLEYAQKIEELKSLDNTEDTLTSFNEQNITTSLSSFNANKLKNKPPEIHQSFHSRQSYSPVVPNKSNYNRISSNQNQNKTMTTQVQNINAIPKPPYQCYNCGGNDHYIRNCPHFQ